VHNVTARVSSATSYTHKHVEFIHRESCVVPRIRGLCSCLDCPHQPPIVVCLPPNKLESDPDVHGSRVMNSSKRSFGSGPNDLNPIHIGSAGERARPPVQSFFVLGQMNRTEPNRHKTARTSNRTEPSGIGAAAIQTMPARMNSRQSFSPSLARMPMHSPMRRKHI
jgi:hypothetical protein